MRFRINLFQFCTFNGNKFLLLLPLFFALNGATAQTISNTAINTYSIHLGLGLPVKAPRILTYCNLGFEIGGRGMDNIYSNESYFKFNAFFTFADKWFGRTKFE